MNVICNVQSKGKSKGFVPFLSYGGRDETPTYTRLGSHTQ